MVAPSFGATAPRNSFRVLTGTMTALPFDDEIDLVVGVNMEEIAYFFRDGDLPFNCNR
jgi:hypothetical protein